MHADSRFFVEGTLKVMGALGDSVVFRGDRLEPYFVDLPGNWQGIHLLRSSRDNEINYAVIKEAIVGVRVDSLKETASPKLTIRNSVINYTLSSGLLGITTDIAAENCLLINSGQNAAQLEFGGNYEFNNCTFAVFGNIVTNHQDAAVRLSNYFAISETEYFSADLQAEFVNCLISGGLENELERDSVPDALYATAFQNCLIKTDNFSPAGDFSNCIFNEEPLFFDIGEDDYHLTENSPCIDAGLFNGIATDLDGQPRDSQIDIGCYEFQQ
jgi:hypothetical protein